MYVYIYRFQNVFLRCPTPRLHCFLSSHWPSFRFLSFMAFLIPSTQFFFGLPRAVSCFGIHFNAILDNLPSAILWTWPYLVSWFCSISSIIVSSNPICFLMVMFLILWKFYKGLNDEISVGVPEPVNRIFVKVVASRRTRPTFVGTSFLFTSSLPSGTSLFEDSNELNSHISNLIFFLITSLI